MFGLVFACELTSHCDNEKDILMISKDGAIAKMVHFGTPIVKMIHFLRVYKNSPLFLKRRKEHVIFR
jgi:hypothetical protein